MSLLVTVLAGCSAKPAARVAEPLASEPTESVRLCTPVGNEWEEPKCLREFTPEEQRRKSWVERLTFRNGRVSRMDSINGRGSLMWQPPRPTTIEYVREGERVTEMRHLDRNGVLRKRTTISADGRDVRWLDSEARPLVLPETRASGLRRELDAQGRERSRTYVDARGQPTPGPEGVFEIRLRLEERGVEVELAYFDERGAPMLDKNGVHRLVESLDEHGILNRERFFGVSGEPVARPADGVHSMSFVLNDVGNMTEHAFWGLDGKPRASKGQGACVYREELDAHGTEVARTYYDEQGAPTVSAIGYVTRRQLLDEDGFMVQAAFYDAAGRPMPLGDEGHAIYRRAYDQRKRTVLESYFDADGRPILHRDGFHQIRITHDDRDNVRRVTFEGLGGKPILRSSGYAVRESEYDVDRLIVTRYLGLDDAPVLPNLGFSELRYSYDDVGARSETRVTSIPGERNP